MCSDLCEVYSDVLSRFRFLDPLSDYMHFAVCMMHFCMPENHPLSRGHHAATKHFYNLPSPLSYKL